MKRDRWESTSEDEAEENKKIATSQNHANKPTEAPPITTLPKEKHSATTKLPLHNPLLQGCRSVYDSYERVSRLDEGTYGVVWSAKDLATDETVALKQIKFDSEMTKEGFPVTALREISVLLALQHESIVSVREMVVGTGLDKVFMVMELFDMDLKDVLEKHGSDPFPQSYVKSMLHQILSGVEHIHEKWFLHRDLKTSNILVQQTKGRLALCDFGLARAYQDPLQPLTQMVVTLWYRPPELLFGETVYGPAVDMWSVGCIFGELLKRDAIMQGQGELDQTNEIFTLLGSPTETTWPDFDKLPNAGIFRWKTKKESGELARRFPVNSPSGGQTFLDGNGYHLLSRLLALDPKQRINATEALQHAYFREGVAQQSPTFDLG